MATLDEQVMAVSDAVGAFAEAVDFLGAADEPPDLIEVVNALVKARAVAAQFRDATAYLAAQGAAVMPQRQMLVDGLGTIERTAGYTRKDWDHGALMTKVVQWARDDLAAYAREHDGEVVESEGQAVVRLLQKYGHLSYWKVTNLHDERGLDTDEYCRREANRPGIRLPRT